MNRENIFSMNTKKKKKENEDNEVITNWNKMK